MLDKLAKLQRGRTVLFTHPSEGSTAKHGCLRWLRAWYQSSKVEYWDYSWGRGRGGILISSGKMDGSLSYSMVKTANEARCARCRCPPSGTRLPTIVFARDRQVGDQTRIWRNVLGFPHPTRVQARALVALGSSMGVYDRVQERDSLSPSCRRMEVINNIAFL